MNILEVIERERRERQKYQTVLQCRYITKEAFDAALDRITAAAKELQAQMPRTVKPVNDSCTCGTFVRFYGIKQSFCSVCGAKLDWSKEDA